MFSEVFMVNQVLNPGQPLAKDTGKEVDFGEGEKGVTISYLVVDISKISYTFGQVALFKD